MKVGNKVRIKNGAYAGVVVTIEEVHPHQYVVRLPDGRCAYYGEWEVERA